MMFRPVASRCSLRSLVVVLALAAAATAQDSATPQRIPSAPRSCPSYCTTCVRRVGKNTSNSTTVPDPNGCFETFVPNKKGTACVCPPGTALNGTRCDECPPNSVSPGGKPSATKCKVCPPPLIANEAGTKCIKRPPQCGSAVCGTVSGAYCGACPTGQTCDNGVCKDDSSTGQGGCTPLLCDPGRLCGSQPDGCGGTANCGTCAPGEQCVSTPTGGAVCQGTAPCVPLTACGAGRLCGSQPDGCGGTLNCGTCPQGQQCVSNSTAAVCETPCTPLTACDAGRLCGSQPDGCGGTLNCGTCPQGQQCVSNSTAAVCETPCTPLLSPCTVDTDCCGNNNTGAQVICNNATCTYKPDGGACIRDGACGMCHPNCGTNTLNATCSYYGFSTDTCNQSGAGGGGKFCGQTNVCCIVFTPTPITPNAQNDCLPKS